MLLKKQSISVILFGNVPDVMIKESISIPTSISFLNLSYDISPPISPIYMRWYRYYQFLLQNTDLLLSTWFNLTELSSQLWYRISHLKSPNITSKTVSITSSFLYSLVSCKIINNILIVKKLNKSLRRFINFIFFKIKDVVKIKCVATFFNLNKINNLHWRE